MPQHYTVPTSNAFAALDDSDNEDAILSKPDEVLEAPKPARPAADAKRAPRGAQAPANRSAPRPRRPETPERDSPVAGDEAQAARRNAGSVRARGGLATRGSGRGQRPVASGQREFDRHSGTGRGKEMKKGGGGAHNWGNEPNDFGGDDQQPRQGSGEWPTATGAEGETTEAPVEEQKPPQEEEKPKTQSYADYLASRQEQQAALPVRETATEALEEDRKKYIQDGYHIYTKDRAVAEKEVQGGDSGDEKQRPRTMHLAEVAEQSGVSLNYRGQRGGRGGRNPGPQRTNSKPQSAATAAVPSKEINLSDNQAFPTLQAH